MKGVKRKAQSAQRARKTREPQQVVNDASPADGAASTSFEQSAPYQVVLRRAVMRGNAGQHEKALPEFRRAVEINPTDPVALYNLGVTLFNLELFAEAIAIYRKLIKLVPRSAGVYRNFGQALDAAGQISEAIAAYRRSIEINPDDAATHFFLGVTLANNTDQAFEALTELNKAYYNGPDDAEYEKVYFDFFKAQVYKAYEPGNDQYKKDLHDLLSTLPGNLNRETEPATEIPPDAYSPARVYMHDSSLASDMWADFIAHHPELASKPETLKAFIKQIEEKFGPFAIGVNPLARGSLEEDRAAIIRGEIGNGPGGKDELDQLAEAAKAIDDALAGATAEQPVHVLLIGGGEISTFRIAPKPHDIKSDGVHPAQFRRLFRTLAETEHEGQRPVINVLIAPTRFEIRLTPPNAPDEAYLIVLARTPEEAKLLDDEYDTYNGLVDESNSPVYTREGRAGRQTTVDLPPENMDDETAILRTASDLLSRIYPRECVEKALGGLAEAARETTSRSTKEPPRLKWGIDREPDETPSHFAARAYAGEIAAGTFDKALIRRDDKTLYQRLFRDKAWPELEALIASRVPTKSQRISQRLTELAEHGERPTRSEDIRLYEAERYRSRGAHMKP